MTHKNSYWPLLKSIFSCWSWNDISLCPVMLFRFSLQLLQEVALLDEVIPLFFLRPERPRVLFIIAFLLLA